MSGKGWPVRFLYPAELWHAGPGEVVVSFRDIQGCHTSGADEAEALNEAQDALEEAIAGRINRGDSIPAPSRALPGEHLVAVPTDTTAKAALMLASRKEIGQTPNPLVRGEDDNG